MPFDPVTGEPIPDPSLPPHQQPLVVHNHLPAPPPPSAPQITPELKAYFDAETYKLVEQARVEEKNKLYPQIDDLKGKLTVLTTEYEERKAAEETAQQQAAEIERQRLEQEASAKDLIAQYQSESERRFAQLEEDRARERALWQKEADFRSLEDYKARRRAEEADNIVPQFMDFIRGETQEQIEASIADLKARSDALLGEIQAAQGPQRRPTGLPVTGGPPVDMARIGEDGSKSFTPTDLANMSMDEYAAMRPQLLAAGSQQIRERGLYG